MDKNTVIGLLLILLLFLGFSFYQSSQVKKQQEAQKEQMMKEEERTANEASETLSLDNQTDTTQSALGTANANLPLAQQFSNAQVSDGDDYIVETDKAIYHIAKKEALSDKLN